MYLRFLSSTLMCLLLTACGENTAPRTEPVSNEHSGNVEVQRTDYPIPPEGGKPSMTPILQLSSTPLPLPTTTSTSPTVEVDRDAIHPFATTLPGIITFARDTDFWEQGGIFRLTGGAMEQVLSGPAYDVDEVSPNGQYAIALRDLQDPPDGDIYHWYNLQTGQRETVEVTLRLWNRNLIPAPDGVHIAANYECSDGRGAVFLGTFSSFREAMQPDPVLDNQCNTGDPFDDFERALIWLPDSSGVILYQIHYTDRQASERLIERYLEGRDKVLYELPAGQLVTNVRISANGRWIIFKPSADPTNPIALHMLDRQTGIAEAIAIPGYIPRQGIISPDGRYLLFSENPSVDNGQCLYLTDLQALEQEPVCLVRGYQVFAWIPDP